MIALLYVVSIIMTIFLTKKRTRLEGDNKKETLPYYLIDNMLLVFFQPLAGVLSFYYLLLFAVMLGASFLSTETLIVMETKFLEVKGMLGWLKDPMNVLRVLEVLFLLGILGVPLLQSRGAFEWATTYRRQIKRVYSIAIFLCCFTLLGSQLGEPALTLSVQIRENREGFGLLKQEAEQALTQETAHALYNKVRNSLPPSYAASSKALESLPWEARQLSTEYQEARNRVGIPALPGVESVARRYSQAARVDNTASLEKAAYVDAADASSIKPPATMPKEVSGRQIQASREAVSKRPPIQIELLKEEGGKAIVLQAPKVITDRVKGLLVHELVQQHPMLEALFSVVSSTLDKQVEATIKARTERLITEVITNPDAAPTTITTTATEIAAATPIQSPPQARVQAERAQREVNTRTMAVRDARTKVDREVQLHISKLIDQLTSPRENVREAAVTKLSKLGESMKQRQVERLNAMLRDRNMRWSKPTSREGHCTWYEETNAAHYAGRTISDLRSPHVTPKMSQEAQRAIADGRIQSRVTDPGWI